MPNVVRGDRMAGLMTYLVGPGRANEHTEPHLVAGDGALMAWHNDDELGRDGSVPAVLLEAKREVEAAARLHARELGALAERDRRAAVPPVLAHPEAQVSTLADSCRRRRLDAGHEERRLGVAEPERGEAVELLGEPERQRSRRHDRVDDRERPQVDVREPGVRLGGEGVGEGVEPLG